MLSQDGFDKELRYSPSHDHYFESPLIKKDFTHWKTSGNTVFLKDKLVLVPQSRDGRGSMLATTPNQFNKAWIAELEFHIGNEHQQSRTNSMLAIFYLKDVENADF